MSVILDQAKYFCSNCIYILNQPLVKESIKNIASAITFSFGLAELGNFIMQEHTFSVQAFSNSWLEVANTITDVCAKISLVLSASVSRPGVYIISSLTGVIFSTEQLEMVWGPNTIYAINPHHPRHLISFAAVILALPSNLQIVYQGLSYLYQDNLDSLTKTEKKAIPATWLSDTQIKIISLFNTFTSRPLLHLGNQWAQSRS